MATDKRGYNILIIEDNPGDFVLVEDFLFDQIEAPVISQAKTFKEAKDVLLNGQCKFDIILLDLSLPDKTGEALILDIIEICANVPVIVLTGYSDFTFGVKSLSLGVSDYILKDGLTSLSLYKSIVYSTERRKSISDLKESEKRYSDVFHFSPLPMWIVDLNSLEFLDVNRATINHYGYTREEFLSMTLKDIRPVEEIPKLELGIAEDRKNSGTISNRIMIHKKKNGELMNVEVQISPFQYKGIKVNIVIANDITERLNYVKAIESQNEKLREISWIQSHIVRAPLARIMGLVSLFKDLKEDDDLKDKMLGYLEISANELDEIIKEITEKTKIAY
jgi:PAS domain S-box-containing protein